MSASTSAQVRIRPAEVGDAERIAILSGQLGYEATAEQVRQRLRRLEGNSEHASLVAETPGGDVVGWLHVHLAHTLELDTQAEISGLVVEEAWRSRGVGRVLMDYAEKWARAQGCRMIRLRTNVLRERAHTFYERLGYELWKTQKAFRKLL